LIGVLLSISSAVACALSERAVATLARAIGAFWWNVLRWRRSVAAENIAQAFPERSPAQRRALGKAAFVHLVHTLFDLLRIPLYAARGFDNVEIHGLEHWEAVRGRGKGALCVTGHVGSFELAIAAIAARVDTKLSVVVKPFGPGLDRFITDSRTGSGLALIPARNALRPILGTLAKGEPVLFVLDQNATRKIGVFVDFFGKPACTMSALAVLALRTGSPVLAATAHREPNGAHVIRLHPEIPLEKQASIAETVRHMTARYTRFIEDAIRAHPEQWMWTHKRWRTRP
jgi:KDO2-lipid IV(A) lauroyltransferase